MGEVRLSGPLFDGRIAAIMDSYCQSTEKVIAQRGVQMVRSNLDKVLQHPSGRYRSNIKMNNRKDSIVWDGPIVYGNWLEGTGSRNKTTRFKGYWTFKKTTKLLQAEAVELAEKNLALYIGRMG